MNSFADRIKFKKRCGISIDNAKKALESFYPEGFNIITYNKDPNIQHYIERGHIVCFNHRVKLLDDIDIWYDTGCDAYKFIHGKMTRTARIYSTIKHWN